MLLACLQGEHKGALAAAVPGHAHDASGHLADEFLGAAHVAHIRTAERHGDAEALAVAHGDVGAPLAGCLQQGEVGDDAVEHKQGLGLVDDVGIALQVFDDAIAVGLLHDDTCHASLSQFGIEVGPRGVAGKGFHGHQFDAVEVGVGGHHLCHFGVDGFGDEHLARLLGGGHTHHGGLSGGSGSVVERGIGNVHAREFGHHRLELKDIMEGSL